MTGRSTGKIIFLSREGRDLGVAFQAPPGSQASSRGEAKDSALLSSRDAGLLEPPERQGVAQGASEKTLILWSWEGPLGTPLGVV